MTTHITPADGNVFADLGFPPEEAAALKAESQRRIAAKQAIKEQLAKEIASWVSSKKLTQAQAAPILGVTRPRVSDAIGGKFSKFSIDALVDMLARTGRQVELSIR